tara:strand:+ start:1780 stop:2409 length:630 start_codon:yes stop_codon:yes gene_type:complete
MSIDNLPKIIPIFPLNGALLLPQGNLPLNIFEPRYLSMVDYAMKNEKMIGMIQNNKKHAESDKLYSTGCLGKINQYSETNDGRYLINLIGVTRFKVVKEINTEEKFRKLEVNYLDFKGDFNNNFENCFNKEVFLNEVRNYLEKNKIEVDWQLIQNVDNTLLITTLASICPFSIAEKQMILECPNTDDIPKTLLNLFKMSDQSIESKSSN